MPRLAPHLRGQPVEYLLELLLVPGLNRAREHEGDRSGPEPGSRVQPRLAPRLVIWQHSGYSNQ